jgi:hypothetical protein
VSADLTPAPDVAALHVCGATAASCVCSLAPDHDGPHECAPDTCTGSWSGSIDMDDFEVHRLPYPVAPR